VPESSPDRSGPRLAPRRLPEAVLARWFPGIALPAVMRVAIELDGAPYGLRFPTHIGG
jgi:hypothetical protein